MFNKRQAPASGFSKQQRQMLARYDSLRQKALTNTLRMDELLGMDSRPRAQVLELAQALDEYGTPAQRELFIDTERAVIDRVIGLSVDELSPQVHAALADEAAKGWPSVRAFPTFADMERSMRASSPTSASGRSWDEVFETASFIGPNSGTSRIVWLSAYGGPTPVSWMDMAHQMTCAAAFTWMQAAKTKMESQVRKIMLSSR